VRYRNIPAMRSLLVCRSDTLCSDDAPLVLRYSNGAEGERRRTRSNTLFSSGSPLGVPGRRANLMSLKIAIDQHLA
jgi:hypothetical protein